MKTISVLSVAIATSLASHLVFAMPAGNLPSDDCMMGNPVAEGMMSQGGGKGLGKLAKRQAKIAGILAKFDANQDGQITQDEVLAKRAEKLSEHADKVLAKFDTNQDGQITQDEVQAARAEKFKAHADKIMAKFDLNQDGQITLDEVQALHTERFKEIDTDSNGFLSYEEFQKGAPRPQKGEEPGNMQGHPMGPMGEEGPDDMMDGPRKGGKGQHQPGGAGGGDCTPPANGQAAGAGKGGKGGKEQLRQEHFNSLDTDSDGQVSAAEFMADLPLFDKFDCDSNGVITQDDLLQGPCAVPDTTEGDGTASATTPPLPVFNKFDCNQDGVVTTEELQQGPCENATTTEDGTATTTPPLPVMDKFDCNQDGVVTTEELQSGPCDKAQPATGTTTGTTTPPATTEQPATVETPAVEEPAAEEVVEEQPVEETDTTATQPTMSSDHGGGAPCSTCH
jgi:Ca2+-binding EF-hand superfamily protein